MRHDCVSQQRTPLNITVVIRIHIHLSLSYVWVCCLYRNATTPNAPCNSEVQSMGRVFSCFVKSKHVCQVPACDIFRHIIAYLVSHRYQATTQSCHLFALLGAVMGFVPSLVEWTRLTRALVNLLVLKMVASDA